AQTDGVALELFQVIGEPREGVRLDARCLIAQLFPLGKCARRAVALLPYPPDRLVVPGAARLVDEEQRGAFGMSAHARASASASSSARCTTRSGFWSRRKSPCRCMRQDR